MSEYLYIFRGGLTDALGRKPTPAEQQANMQKWGTWIKALTEKGVSKGGQPLDMENGKVLAGKNKTLTDGPFAEAKDIVGGYLVVNAKSLDEATEHARGCPIFENGGSVEVRTIMAM